MKITPIYFIEPLHFHWCCYRRPSVPAWAAEKPNLIFIMADDVGRGDFQCYNPKGKILSPNTILRHALFDRHRNQEWRRPAI
jgi:hypothetical protein